MRLYTLFWNEVSTVHIYFPQLNSLSSQGGMAGAEEHPVRERKDYSRAQNLNELGEGVMRLSLDHTGFGKFSDLITHSSFSNYHFHKNTKSF